MNRLFLKTTGDSTMGLGHVSRLVGLMRALPDNWSFLFYVNDNPAVTAFLQHHQMPFVTAGTTQQLKDELARGYDKVIYDETGIDTHFFSVARDCGVPFIGALDFFFCDSFYADAVVTLFNQHPQQHIPPPPTRYFEGLAYTIINQRFWPLRQVGPKPTRTVLKTVLVMYGGADPNKNTLKTLQFLNACANQLDIHVIVGPLNPHRRAIDEYVQSSPHQIQVWENPAHLPTLMAQADMAFTGCGTTCFELGFLGVPSVVVWQNIAEERLAKHLDQQGVVFAGEDLADCWQRIQPDATRQMLSDKAQQTFDGQGALRVLSCFDII